MMERGILLCRTPLIKGRFSSVREIQNAWNLARLSICEEMCQEVDGKLLTPHFKIKLLRGKHPVFV